MGKVPSGASFETPPPFFRTAFLVVAGAEPLIDVLLELGVVVVVVVVEGDEEVGWF